MFFRRGRQHCAKVPNFRAEHCHFTQGCQVSSMANYTYAELADMHLAYGAADCSGPATQCLYDIRGGVFPGIISLRICIRGQTGSFQRAGREQVRIVRIPAIELRVLQQMQEISSTKYVKFNVYSQVSRSSILRILREHDMHPFHVQRIQTLQPDNFLPRITLEQWYLGKRPTDLLFMLKYCFLVNHPMQGKDFSTRIKPTCKRRRTRIQYDVVPLRLDFRSLFESVLQQIPSSDLTCYLFVQPDVTICLF